MVFPWLSYRLQKKELSMSTTNLGLTLPTVGSSSDVWGDNLNADLALIDTFAGKLMGAAEVTVASASTCDIGAAASTAVAISGTTNITSLGTATNTIRFIRFTGATLVLTYNATSLITPTAANIQAAAGDTCIAQSDGSGNWRIRNYTRGVAPVQKTGTAFAISGSVGLIDTMTLLPAGKWRFSLLAANNAGGSGEDIVVMTTTSGALTGGTLGQNQTQYAIGSNGRGSGSIPAYDVTLTAATTYYLNGTSNASSPSFYYTWKADPII